MEDLQMQALNRYFRGQAEAGEDVIEIGDYVRIVEDNNLADQRLIYLCDIQAVFVVRRASMSEDTIIIQYKDEGYWLNRSDAYLVDVDALHGEMEEMIAEEAEEKSDAIIAALRVTVDEPKSLTDRVIETYEARLNSYDAALAEVQAERDSLLARNALLEAKLTPFALAAKISQAAGTPDGYELVTTWDEKPIRLSGDEYLSVRHLNEALSALPNVDAGAANGGS